MLPGHEYVGIGYSYVGFGYVNSDLTESTLEIMSESVPESTKKVPSELLPASATRCPTVGANCRRIDQQMPRGRLKFGPMDARGFREG